MSSIKSLVPGTPKGWTIAGFSIVFLIVAIARLLGSSAAAVAALIVGLSCLLVVALSWFLITFLMRRGRQRRQHQFDAGIAAREGIDDRRREWQGWVDELEKNGIDRYELPFYLLVGEPQSGKSVLLQNSDLRFLFGQSRLSGIGGTRGCDWWFTDEAVILDLAGRLFTHEGGASDEAEWDAFLDLVNDFRPLDPANGIMLVIPCDVLLGDSPEVCAQKASKSREALLSLTRKLEAKLPIYVILTKADKIFGFAESVHRLTLEQRHQMFGWSRSADHLDEPFDTNELRGAWDGIVQRGDTLRNQMLATARLPEALPEVDRLLGFPEELRGLYGPLEAYLNRIFVGSELVEQLYFRGIYLTSGLQSGAPIAKVFLDILDRPGEADERDLEKLFVRQQAYFIKDLIRDRVFGERGLVKPTSARVERAKKKSWVGYGVAASVALVSLFWGIFEIRSNYEASGQETYDAAIEAAAKIQPEAVEESRAQGTDPLEVASLLDVLETIEGARDRQTTVMQRLHASRQPQLKALYETIYDRVYRNELQKRGAEALLEMTRPYVIEDRSQRPANYARFLEQAEAVVALAKGIRDAKSAGQVATVLPADNEAERKGLVRRAEDAHEQRGEGFEVETSDPSVVMAATSLRDLWAATLDPIDPVSIDGAVGVCLGWWELTQFDETVRGAVSKTTVDESIYTDIERASLIIANLDDSVRASSELPVRGVIDFQQEGHELEILAGELDRLIGEGASEQTKAWREKREVICAWLQDKDQGLGDLALTTSNSLEEKLEPLKERYLNRTDLKKVVSDDCLGRNACDQPAALGREIKDAVVLASSETELVASVAKIKLLLVRDGFPGAYPDWASIESALCTEDTVDLGTIASWIRTQEVVLDLLEATEFAAAEPNAIDLGRLTEHLRRCGERGIEEARGRLPVQQVNPDAMEALVQTRIVIPASRTLGAEIIGANLLAVREGMGRDWDEQERAWREEDGPAAAPKIAGDALEHLTRVSALDEKVDIGRRAWTQRTGQLLDRRFDEYSARIQDAINDHARLEVSGDLNSAIDQITAPEHPEVLIGGSDFKPLRAWVDSLPEELKVPEHNDEQLARFFNQAGAPSADAWGAYRLASRPGSLPSGNQPPRALYDYVTEFTNGPGKALQRSDLARKYFSAESPLPQPTNDPDDASRGIYLAFSRALASSFNDAVVLQLRADYLAELREHAVEDDPEQLEEFWYDPAAASGRSRVHEDPVDHFFGEEGEYLRLLQRYQIPEHSDQDFRVGVEGLAQELPLQQKNLWRIDHFLQQMLLYVRGAETVAGLSPDQLPEHPLGPLEDFKMTLKASSEPGGFEETWKRWNSFRSPLFTDQSGATSIQDPRSEEEIIVTNTKTGWGFEKRRPFQLEWRDGAGSGWVPYKVQTSLIPLQLFWSDRKSRSTGTYSTKQQSSALVNFEVTKGQRAPFELTIDPAPPRRPDLDLKDLLNK